MANCRRMLWGKGAQKSGRKKDAYGVRFWRIYDPTTGDLFTARTEEEVRLILEQRYADR